MMKKILTLAVAVIVCGGCCDKALKQAQVLPVVRIGVVADVQYADREPVPQYDSYYRPSVAKLKEFVDVMNSQDLDFVIQLGDYVDSNVKSYETLAPIWSQLKAPTKSVIGNHDMEASGGYSTVLDKLGLEKSYYDFEVKGWRFIVLDTNEIGTLGGKPGEVRYDKAKKMLDSLKELGFYNALVWNSTVSDEQVQWLDQRLALADENGEKVIVFGHHTILSNEPGLNIWNAGRVVRCFQKHKSFKAYICGHHHEGSFVMVDDVYYLTMKAMMSTPDTNAFSVIQLYPDRIEIDGYGRESDKRLPIR